MTEQEFNMAIRDWQARLYRDVMAWLTGETKPPRWMRQRLVVDKWNRSLGRFRLAFERKNR